VLNCVWYLRRPHELAASVKGHGEGKCLTQRYTGEDTTRTTDVKTSCRCRALVVRSVGTRQRKGHLAGVWVNWVVVGWSDRGFIRSGSGNRRPKKFQ